MTTHARAVEVDTRLADLWGQEQDAHQRIRQDLQSLHSLDGQRRPWDTRDRAWPLNDEETEESIRTKLSTKDLTANLWFSHPSVNDGEPYLTSNGQYAQRTVDEMDALRQTLVDLDEQAAPLEAEYRAERWPRFFLVMNTGGHIHSSMSCQTTFPTTQWSWLPDLSGLTEDAAVDAQGPRLCSVCYPSAPVEWTLGLPKAPQCPGSKRPAAPGRERYRSQPCSVCGKYFPVSDRTGLIRAHKPAKEA